MKYGFVTLTKIVIHLVIRRTTAEIEATRSQKMSLRTSALMIRMSGCTSWFTARRCSGPRFSIKLSKQASHDCHL